MSLEAESSLAKPVGKKHSLAKVLIWALWEIYVESPVKSYMNS